MGDVTIVPTPCGKPVLIGERCGVSWSTSYRTYTTLCSECIPLGARLIDHATAMGEYGFDEDWAYLLTWNLTLASLLHKAKETP